MIKYIFLILFISTQIVALTLSSCNENIVLIGSAVDSPKKSKKYIIIENNDKTKIYFSIKETRLACPGSYNNIDFSNIIEIKNTKKLIFKKDLQYKVTCNIISRNKDTSFKLNIDSLEEQWLKVRARTKKNKSFIDLRMLFLSNMIGEHEVQKTDIKQDYITNITISTNDKTLYSISTSSLIAHHPSFFFKISNQLKSNFLEIYTTENNGNQKKGILQIPEENGIRPSIISTKYSLPDNHITLKKEVWEATTPNKAIQSLYGTTKIIEDKIDLKVPKVVDLIQWSFPVTIKSDIEFESIAVFMDGHLPSTILIIDIKSKSTTYFKFRVKAPPLGQKSNIIVIGQTKDGKLYKASKDMEFFKCSNAGG